MPNEIAADEATPAGYQDCWHEFSLKRDNSPTIGYEPTRRRPIPRRSGPGIPGRAFRPSPYHSLGRFDRFFYRPRPALTALNVPPPARTGFSGCTDYDFRAQSRVV